MKTKERIDADCLANLEAFIGFFAALGLAGLFYLLGRVLYWAWGWLQELGLWLLLVGLPLAGMALSATALLTCLRWWIIG
jgi:hypothetical protein